MRSTARRVRASARPPQPRAPGDREDDPRRSDRAWRRAQDNAPFLFRRSEGWHAGVVGIVAGRLKDRFGKPAFVAGFEGGMGARLGALGRRRRHRRGRARGEGGGRDRKRRRSRDGRGLLAHAKPARGVPRFPRRAFADFGAATDALDLNIDALYRRRRDAKRWCATSRSRTVRRRKSRAVWSPSPTCASPCRCGGQGPSG